MPHVLRSRFATVAVGATVLGVTAALVPAVSNAADTTATPAATADVVWADQASDFTVVPDAEGPAPIAEGWNLFANVLGTNASTNVSDYLSFGANGITAKDGQFVPLVHPLSSAVTADGLAALVSNATANVGTDAEVGLVLSDADTPTTLNDTVYATNGFAGDATTWNGDETTAELATQLTADHEVVSGYFIVLVGGNLPAARTAPNGAQNLFTAPAVATSRAAAVPAAAVTPAAAGAASIAVGDTTTYFTPQPTATLTLTTTSATVSAATTTGVPFTASGFAPGETVTAGIGGGERGDDIAGVTFVADADGNVAGTLVLPASFVTTAGDYTLALIGSSSQQSAQATITITADPAAPAPVAVPVSGRATFTG